MFPALQLPWRAAVRWARGSAVYVQGQSPEPRIREYFYYIDHQGQLFLDDTKVKNFITCFKDQQFLVFFFSRLRSNDSGRYQDNFPFVSLCGRERNFLRCDDKAVVFTHLLSGQGQDKGGGADQLSYCGGGSKLQVPFQPEALFVHPESGRLYHPCPERAGSVGLLRSALAFELSTHFEYTQGRGHSRQPTHFQWAGQRYILTNELARHFSSEEEGRS